MLGVEHAMGRSPLQKISAGSSLRRTGSMREQLEYIMNAVDRIETMQKCILH